MNNSEPSYRPANDCFRETQVYRASHLLYDDFLNERPDINKFIFYLWLQENHSNKYGKAADGNSGYRLEYIPKSITNK